MLCNDCGCCGYTWSVPNVNYENCRIRIEDAYDSSKFDESESYFSVVPTEEITVISPNGDEQFIANNTYEIIYLTEEEVETVNIYYSLDNGVGWSWITGGHDGGVYSWEVPNTPSEEVLIKIVDSNNSCKWDISDAVFSIISQVDITYPDGGEQLQATIAAPFGTGEYYMDNVDLVTDGGYLYDSGGPNSNYDDSENYTKTIYPETPGNKIRLKNIYHQMHSWSWPADYIEIWNNDEVSGGANWTFHYDDPDWTEVTSSHSTGALTVRFISNNSYTSSGFKMEIESINQPTELIQWDIIGTSNVYDIFYSTDGLEGEWYQIENDYYSTNGQYAWAVPNTPSDNCLIKVVDIDNEEQVFHY